METIDRPRTEPKIEFPRKRYCARFAVLVYQNVVGKELIILVRPLTPHEPSPKLKIASGSAIEFAELAEMVLRA